MPSAVTANLRAIAEFENEGGRVSEAPAAANSPLLPFSPGCTAQPAWGFRDATGRVFYWFFCVYGPEDPGRLNQGLSYWAATWLPPSESGSERPQMRSMTYQEARTFRHSRLSFERFSSQVHMRDRLPVLLNVEVGPPSI